MRLFASNISSSPTRTTECLQKSTPDTVKGVASGRKLGQSHSPASRNHVLGAAKVNILVKGAQPKMLLAIGATRKDTMVHSACQRMFKKYELMLIWITHSLEQFQALKNLHGSRMYPSRDKRLYSSLTQEQKSQQLQKSPSGTYKTNSSPLPVGYSTGRLIRH